MKIAIAGCGYVGLSLATLLALNNEVIAYEILEERVKLINKRISPIKDKEIENYFKNKNLNLKATLDYEEAFKNAKYIIISTPTNYNEETNYFDTSSVEDIIEKVISLNLDTTIIIKSTVPFGFVDSMKEKYNIDNIIFSPEFLREGRALYDCLYPSRIIVGDKSEKGREFANLLKDASLKEDVPILLMDSKEAEAVKLFANTYLAMRVAFFNELDTFALVNSLNVKDIIDGVSKDARIGNHYNNPSFGYGGYCLPKDTKQLLSNYKNIKQELISAIIDSNKTRKAFIVDMILKDTKGVIGIYKLIMKSNSDNYRQSAIQDIIEELKNKNKEIIIYEPTYNKDEFNGIKVIKSFEEFCEKSSIIVANRYEDELKTVKNKVFTRDVFNEN